MCRSVLPRASVGIGFKPVHAAAIAQGSTPAPAFFEIHAENYLGDGGPPHRVLTALRRDHALSIHAVGLSLGSAAGLDEGHVQRLQALVDRYEPALVSDHLSWSRAGRVYAHDLLPLPYTDEAFAIVAAHIEICQARLKRPLLIENPSAYLRLKGSTQSEAAFMNALCRKTGCRLLLDINNLYVSATNLGDAPASALDAIEAAYVEEIHLAGHAREEHPGGALLIDDHGSAVGSDVWALYARFIARHGPRPTLIEWDTDIPAYETLAAEAEKARRIMTEGAARDAA
jgi:uncharacterized protein (UPF0276 family)